MRAVDLHTGRIAIWGLGREGRAAIGLLRARHPDLPLLLLDDDTAAKAPDGFRGVECAFGGEAIARALGRIDVLVKSPGVSLYRPEIAIARARGVAITSLLNLWFAEKPAIATICVTGTKGKSTTASLIAHLLGRLGRRVALAGNIGVPVTEIDPRVCDHAVIEMSSYQAADFCGCCDIAVLTSLYPEHIDWHRTLAAYFHDKLNLLRHSRVAIVNYQAAATIAEFDDAPLPRGETFNDVTGLHAKDREIFDGDRPIGTVANRYLSRPHNLSNLCAALSVAKRLGLDLAAALEATADFQALPHRQQELGEIGGVLFVDDSISTAPESTLAALEVYAGRHIAVIVGGYDRGINYGKLVAALAAGAARAVICLGNSGERIWAGLRAAAAGSEGCAASAYRAQSMEDAVGLARRLAAPGGVVLLSPAAPSYGYYRDFAERGRDFARIASLAGDPQTTR
ncbi:MAG: UDP-N-acetylmuramoyl-L-alanine--D-glutamate ligase [Stellaceae bacterium]